MMLISSVLRDICKMFKNPLVRFSFHLSWFLLILGGSSLFEEKYWKIPGVLILGYGLLFLLFTLTVLYLGKKPIVSPRLAVSIALGCIITVILARLFFGQYLLSLVLTVLCIPILIAWVGLGKTKATSKSKGSKR